MRSVAVDAWLALLAGLVAVIVFFTWLELANRLSGRLRLRERLCGVLAGSAAVGLGLFSSNLIAVLSVQALHGSDLTPASILMPLSISLLGPAAVLTILSGGQATRGRIAAAAVLPIVTRRPGGARIPPPRQPAPRRPAEAH